MADNETDNESSSTQSSSSSNPNSPPNTSSLSERSSSSSRGTNRASTSSARDQRAEEREAKKRKKAETERDAALAKQVALEDQIILLRSQLDKMEVSDENKHDTPPTTPEDSRNNPNATLGSLLDHLTDQSVSLQTFSGHDDPLSVIEFIDNVKEVGNLKLWSQPQMFRRALLALRGPAAKAVRNFRSEINSLDQLNKFLNKRYGIARPKEFFQARLSKIRQAQNESGRAFLDRFLNLVSASNSCIKGYFTDEQYAIFLKAALTRPYLLECKRAHANTLEKLMQVIREADTLLGNTSGDKISAVTTRALESTELSTDVKNYINKQIQKAQKETVAPVTQQIHQANPRNRTTDTRPSSRFNNFSRFHSNRDNQTARNFPRQQFRPNPQGQHSWRPRRDVVCRYCSRAHPSNVCWYRPNGPANQQPWRGGSAQRNWRENQTQPRWRGGPNSQGNRHQMSNWRGNGTSTRGGSRFGLGNRNTSRFGAWRTNATRGYVNAVREPATITEQGNLKASYLVTSCDTLVCNKIIQKAVLDTGATRSLISSEFFETLKGLGIPLTPTNVRGPALAGADGKELKIEGEVTLKLTFNSVSCVHSMVIVRDLTHALLLGMDWLTRNLAEIDTLRRELRLNKLKVAVPLHTLVKNVHPCILPVSNLFTSTDVTLPPQTVLSVHATCSPWDPLASATRPGFVRANPKSFRDPISVLEGFTELRGGKTDLSLINTTDRAITLPETTPVASFHPPRVIETPGRVAVQETTPGTSKQIILHPELRKESEFSDTTLSKQKDAILPHSVCTHHERKILGAGSNLKIKSHNIEPWASKNEKRLHPENHHFSSMHAQSARNAPEHEHALQHEISYFGHDRSPILSVCDVQSIAPTTTRPMDSYSTTFGNTGLGKTPRLAPALNALDHALAEAFADTAVGDKHPHDSPLLPGELTNKKPKLEHQGEDGQQTFPTWEPVSPEPLRPQPMCTEPEGTQTEGLRHPDVRFHHPSCDRVLFGFGDIRDPPSVVLNVNEAKQPKDEKPKEIEWPGDTLDAATLETGVEETIFREIPEKDSDRGPEFDFPDFSADDEPDAYRVTFQNKAQPTEQITCSDLYPKVPQPQKIEDKTIPLKLGENLTAEQRKVFLRLAAEFVGVFLRPPGKWKAAKVPPYHIETGDAPPVFQPYRQVPMHQRHLVEEEVESMLKKGVISKTKSPYVNPIVLVKKKAIDDGRKGAPAKAPLRFCIDLRMLNKQQMPFVQRGGIPRIKDVLDSLRGSRFYSAIDLAAAFWAIELTESSKHKTAFLCYYKGVPQQFQFNKLVFGSLGASWAMQNAMNYCLRGLQPHITSVYLDDCVIPGFTFEQHIVNLRKVFSRLQAHGFFIQPAKCVFGQNFLSVLGFTVSHKGIEVQKSKTEAICKMPPPKNKKEVQTFLGLVNFYSSFLLNKSTLLSCLHELTKDKPFVWTKECQQAFEEVKRRLTSPPILAFPDPDAEMIVAVDASNVGVGGILQQKDENGRLRIIACTSRKLTEQQSKAWTVAEKELFSLVHSIQAFDYYLRGQRFRVLTDHKLLANLKFLLKWDRPGRLLRWRLLLQGLDMVVESVKGSDNGPADALSRFPSNDISQVTSVGSINFVSPISMPDAEAMRLAQLADPLYARLINRLKGNPQHDEDINELLAHGGKYELKKINSLLTHSNRFGQGLTVIPPKLRWKVFAFFHNQAGHLAAKKTHSFMRTKVYWRGMSTDIQEFCFQCATCQAGKRKPNKRYGRLQLFSAKRPNQSVGVDVFGPLPETPRGNKVILVMYDRFTRYCSYVPMPNQQSETIARTFFSHWISRFGIPETILTDNYASFLNVGKYLWEKFFKIRHKKISFYMASTNGATERANQVLAATLRSWVDQDSQNGDMDNAHCS